MNVRVINEKIETLVISFANKSEKRVASPVEELQTAKTPPKPSTDQISGFHDRSTAGVELVQVRHARLNAASDEQVAKDSTGMGLKDHTNPSVAKPNELSNSGGEWAQMLDMISKRKTQVLAPENLESMWTKGRQYKKTEGRIQAAKQSRCGAPLDSNHTSNHTTEPSHFLVQDRRANVVVPNRSSASSHKEDKYLGGNLQVRTDNNRSTNHPVASSQDRTADLSHEEIETDSGSSNQTEDEENNTVTGLDTPGIRVWDSKNKQNASVSHVHHPLETSEFHFAKKNAKSHVRPRMIRTSSGRKRSRSSKLKVPIWQEIERTSFLLGEGQDILHEAKHNPKTEALSDDDPASQIWGRVHSGKAASSSFSSNSTTESGISSSRTDDSVLEDPFLKLRCEVIWNAWIHQIKQLESGISSSRTKDSVLADPFLKLRSSLKIQQIIFLSHKILAPGYFFNRIEDLHNVVKLRSFQKCDITKV